MDRFICTERMHRINNSHNNSGVNANRQEIMCLYTQDFFAHDIYERYGYIFGLGKKDDGAKMQRINSEMRACERS